MGDSGECEMCQNCKRDIPVVNYRMHTAHCARNIGLCPVCDEPVPKSGIEEHNEEFHTERECDLCKERMAPNLVEDHKANQCPARVLECQYCHLDCKAGELQEHEGYCGSRTEKCPDCSDHVMLKDWDKHQKMTLYHELANKSCAEVFGYDPVRQIGPEPPIKVKTPWLQTRKTSITSSDSKPPSLSSRKFSVDSYLNSAQPPPLSPTTTSYPSSRWQQGGSRWDTKTSDLAPFTSGGGDPAAPAAAELNGTSHWLKSAYALPNLMDDFPAADEGEDDASAMPPLEPLTPTKLVSSLSFDKTPSSSLMAPWSPPAIKRKSPSPPDETLIPCEFCSEPIALLKLISHQTNCTKNEDSLYFNSQLPPSNAPQTWPEVVANALAEAKDKRVADADNDDEDEGMAGNSNSEEDAPVSQLIDIDLPPPLPPKARSAFGGARPKRRSNNNSGSIVGKYLGSAGKGHDKSDDSPSPRVVEKQSKKAENHDFLKSSPTLNRKASITSSDSLSSRKFSVDSYLSNAQPPPLSPTNTTDEPQTSPTFDSSPSYQPGSFSSFKVNSKGQTKDILFGTRPKNKPSATTSVLDQLIPPPRVLTNRVVNPERDAAERDKLREMLSTLRKDPFDEDLEVNDGSFFPCEFCGDPYPVEFLMRHQLSCDLNPAPVTSGQGFDYSIIRSRAEKNLELGKPVSGINIPD